MWTRHTVSIHFALPAVFTLVPFLGTIATVRLTLLPVSKSILLALLLAQALLRLKLILRFLRHLSCIQCL